MDTKNVIIKNAEVYWCKLNPKKPNAAFNKDNPTWEMQLRTSDKKQAQEWRDQDLTVKLEEVDDGENFWRVNLKKKSKDAEGEPTKPVRVVDGKFNPVDPDTIGNGSVCNVRVLQSEYTMNGKKGIRSTPIAVQVVKLKVYTPVDPMDGFDEVDTEIIDESAEDETPF